MTTNSETSGKAGFTDGPWSGRIWHDPLVVASDPSIDLNIALYTGGQPERYKEWLANGRLIAAAPDMYWALKNLLEDVDDHRGMGYAEFDSEEEARAAIARAEGEA